MPQQTQQGPRPTSYEVTPVLAPVKGIRYDMGGTLIKDDEMTDDRNMYISTIDTMKKREGTLVKGVQLYGIVNGIDQYYLNNGNQFLMAETTTDIVYWYASGGYWVYLTPQYATGTVTILTGSKTTVTGTSTYWDSPQNGYLAIKAGDQIGFGSTNPHSITTWYTVLSVSSDTVLTLTGNGPVIAGGTYVIRQLFTGKITNLWSSEIMIDDYFFTNGVDYVYKWDGTDPVSLMGGHTNQGPLLNIAGSPTYLSTCQYLLKYHDYMLAGLTTESGTPYPQRIRWSDTGLPDTSPNSGYDGWTVGPNSNAGYQDLGDGVDFITGLSTLNDRVIVFKERSIYSGYLSGTSFIFEFDLMINGTGTPSGLTVQNVKNDLIFMGWDNIYSFNGITISAIGDSIKDELFTIINPSAIQQSFSLLVEELDEYQLFITTGTNTYPDTVFRYNYIKKAWTRDTRVNITSAGYYQKETSNTWANTPGTWAEQTARWDDRSLLTASPTYIFGDSGGYIYEWDLTQITDNGTDIDAWFSTKDFTMQAWDIDKYWARIDIIGRGISCDVYYSIDEGASYVSLGTVDFSSSTTFTINKVDFRVTSQSIRFKFENPRAESFEIRQMTLYWKAGGRI